MQRSISLAAAKSSSSTSLCRAIQNFPAFSSTSVARVDRVYRNNVSQILFQRGNATCLYLRLLGSICYAPHWSSSTTSRSFGYSLFTRRFFSHVPDTGNKDSIVGVDENAGGKNTFGFKKFSNKWKKHKALPSTNAQVIGDVSSDIKGEQSTASSSPGGTNGKQVSTEKPKRRPKSKKFKDKTSSVVAVSEAVSLEEGPKSVPKPKHSGSGNRKSSSAKKEVAKNPTAEKLKSPASSNSKTEQQHLKSTKASNAPKQKQVPQHMKNSIEHRGQNASKPLYPPSGKSVIVVESITKANIIQGYLGDMYEVLPSYGHIRNLAARSGSVRPDDDFSMVWEVPSSAWTHIKSIKVALNGAENLILASDPDREGEAIAWHIIEMLQQQGALHESMTVARVVFHEITESAIKSALQSPREIDGDLVHAYLARRAIDYLIGFNISPLLWKKLPGCPSAGRVQSAALALVCDRESEIDGFKPQEYWAVGIKVQGKDNSATFSAHLTSLNSKRLNQLSISSEANAQDIEQRIRSEGFLVKGSKKSTTQKNPPAPYITSTLQQDAANKLHFPTAHTMKLAQKLYEGIQLSDGKSAGLITYMRTDGLHIADEAIKDIQSLVAERTEYVTIKSRVLYPEFRGRMVSAFLTNYFTEVTDYNFTADMETELDNVSGGVTEWKGLLRDYWTRFSAYCKRVEKVQHPQVEKMLEKRYEDFLFSFLPDPSRTCPSCMEGTLSFQVSKLDTGYFIGCNRSPSCKFVAKTLYEEDEDEEGPPKNTCVEEPKLLGLHPNTSEKVILKCGPYGNYVQLGEDKKGHAPKRANAGHIKDVNSITLEGALKLLRYPLTLGAHPEDERPVLLMLSKSGFTVRHSGTKATVPKNTEPGAVTLEKAMKLLSGNNVKRRGRPKRILPEGDEEAAEAM